MNGVRALLRRLRASLSVARSDATARPDATTRIRDACALTAPSARNAVDVFRGEWASRLPQPFADVPAGPLPIFEDPRIHWAVEQFGGVAGKHVLELGPLEGGHTYILERAGAASVTAIEANTRAYLRCLVVKELVGLPNARFLCGDFVEYLRGDPPRVEACVACGVLYHMQNPVELLELIGRVTHRLYLWTMCYDPARMGEFPHVAAKFTGAVVSEHAGFKHTLHRQEYGEGLQSMGFCGGNRPSSYWMEEAEILGALRHFGFTDLRVRPEAPNPNGPVLSVAALRG